MNRSDKLSEWASRQEAEAIQQDTRAAKDLFQFIRQYDKENIPIGICEFLDRSIRDEESYRISSGVAIHADEDGLASDSDVDRILGGSSVSNFTMTRWEAMCETGLVIDGGGDGYEIDPSNVAKYVRYMGFSNPFERSN